MEIICFAANVRQCNIAHSVVHVQVCFQIVFICYYFSLIFANSQSVFILPVGSYFRLVCASGK